MCIAEDQEFVCGNPETYGIPLARENISDQVLINYGITNFDNLGAGMLTIFQVLTLEGWNDLMYNVS